MYGSVNVPGAAATTKHGGAMSAADKLSLETLKELTLQTEMVRTRSGNPVIFPDGAAANVKELVVTLTPSQSGSGDPSPDNVRPISGATSVSVTGSGKNLWCLKTATSTCNGVTYTIDKSAGSVKITGQSASGDTVWFKVAADVMLYPGNYTLSTGLQYNDIQISICDGPSVISRTDASGVANFTLNEKTICTLYVWCNRGINFNDTIYPMLRRASDTDPTFEPYQGQTVTVQLTDGSNPLTVYGGTLNVTTGELTVDYALAVLNSSYTHPVYSDDGLWLCRLKQNGILPGLVGANVACSHYCAINYGISWEYLPNGQCRIADNHFGFRDTRFETWDEANAYLDEQEAAGTPVTICYRIAPVTYQLTPAQLATLSGYNAVFSADAAALSVTYRANPALAYAELESNLTHAILSLGAGI